VEREIDTFMTNIPKEISHIDEFNLWQLLDEADETDTGLSLLLYVVKDKWEKKLKNKFGRKEEKVKTHLMVSGGNYTSDMLLPFMLKRIKDTFPWYPIRIDLAEHAKYSDIPEISHDVTLSGYYHDSDTYSNFKREINAQGYDTTRCLIYDDVSYLACSRTVFESYTKEEILRRFPLVRGRNYRDSSMQVAVPYRHRVAPRGREDEAPFIISDKFYYSYLLMRYSVGLWVTYSSAPYDSKVQKLEELERSRVVRHVIYNKEYEKIGKKITKQMQVFMRKDLQHDKNRAEKKIGNRDFRI